ncbi:FH2 domain-containing protein [Rossellomorea aquimaris]|uniref:hypothetical protein n=1 Tax=Rossellomorea aquimaris TaxID=189382 RepID=UPI0007D071B7|nr:hypothetical protein [Rossellomorea aquimaris]
MSRDPLENLKKQLDKEMFQDIELVSQKRSIMTKIKKQNSKVIKRNKPLTNFAAALMVIVLVTILSSSYLSRIELVEEMKVEDIKEPSAQYTFIPSDEFEEKLRDEKIIYQKSAEKERKNQEEVRRKQEVESKNEEQKNQEETKQKETNQSTQVFDFSQLMNNPEGFKKAAREGNFYLTSFNIGDSYESIKKEYGNKDLIVTGHGIYQKIQEYHLSYTHAEDGYVNAIRSVHGNTGYKLKQVIEVFGEPIYYFDALNDYFLAVYGLGDYQIEMRLEGFNTISTGERNEDIEIIDLGSSITLVELRKNNINSEWYDSEVSYQQDEETEDYNSEWFSWARERIINTTEATEVKQYSQSEWLEYGIYVPENTSDEMIKDISHKFLEELTKVSGQDLQETSLWHSYSYLIYIYKYEETLEKADYYVHGRKKDENLNKWGYPDIVWLNPKWE